MNPLTNVRNLNKLNQRELELGLSGSSTSWHSQYRDSAWVFVAGLPYDLTEGDIIAVFSQYGEIVNINLVRDHKTGKFKGFGFVCYEDQRSTVLAVDNFNGIKLLGRTLRVDHAGDYKPPKEHGDESEALKQLRHDGCAPCISPPEHPHSSPLPTSYDKKKKKKEKKSKTDKLHRKRGNWGHTEEKNGAEGEKSEGRQSGGRDSERKGTEEGVCGSRGTEAAEVKRLRVAGVKTEREDPDYNKYLQEGSGHGSYKHEGKGNKKYSQEDRRREEYTREVEEDSYRGRKRSKGSSETNVDTLRGGQLDGRQQRVREYTAQVDRKY